MIRTLKEYDEMIDNGTLTPENVIHLYIAARLKPLLLNYKCCTENNLEILAEFIADCFFRTKLLNRYVS